MRYLLFDVFAQEAFSGNQLAVFPQADGISDFAMQRLANELNVPESVFLSKLDDEGSPARLRIFTPGREVLFAGHPTVGAAVAIADVLKWVDPSVTHFALKERVGDVEIRIERTPHTIAWLRTPPVTFGATFSREQGAAVLSLPEQRLNAELPVQILSAGNPFLFVPLIDTDSVDAAAIDLAAYSSIASECVGVFLFAKTAAATYARMFAPLAGIAEDPATGSATGPLYAYLLTHGALPLTSASYISEQGTKMGRRSVLHVAVGATNRGIEYVDVGGRAIQVGAGELDDSLLLQFAR